MASICAIVDHATPLAPCPSEMSFSVIINRVVAASIGVPTPQQ